MKTRVSIKQFVINCSVILPLTTVNKLTTLQQSSIKLGQYVLYTVILLPHNKESFRVGIQDRYQLH